MSGSTTIARAAFVAVLGLAAVPGQALASGGYYGPFGFQQEEYGPGVTVSGAGLARVNPPEQFTEDSVHQAVDAAHRKAVTRAVADARQRSEGIAAAVGISLGPTQAVELYPGFREREPCRRSRRTGEVRCSVPAFTSASATVTFDIAGGAASDEGARELSASASESAFVDAKRRTSPAIRHALFAARDAATPEAAKKARANVESAAQGAGLTLGQPFSFVEQQSPYPSNALLGAFAPGIFCGKITRAIIRRDPETGERELVGRRRVRRCFSPRSLPVTLEATYLAQGG